MLHNLRNTVGLGVVIAFAFAGVAACSPLDLPAGDGNVVPAALVASNDDASPEATHTTTAPVVTLTAGPTRTADASETPEASQTPEASATPGVGVTSAPTGTVTSTPMPARGEVELRGILSAINGDTWVVNGVNVIVGPRTEIKGNPRVGGQVKVEGQLQANGSVLAREITGIGLNPTQSSRPERGAEIRGLIRAMNGNTWTVEGFTVIISDTTEVKGTPMVGSPVKIAGTLQADGSLLAREVKVLEREGTRTPEAGKVEFRGLLRAINGDTWIIDGVTVIISRRTEIKGNPAVGDVVKVEGQRQGDGTVAAREIEVVGRDATGTPVARVEIEFTGTLQAMDGGRFVVNGITVVLGPNAEVKGPLAVGDQVKVHGTPQADGSVIAREIERADREDSGGDDHDGEDNSGRGGGNDDHSGGNNGGENRGGDDHGGSGGGGSDDDDHGGGDDNGGGDDRGGGDDGGRGGDDKP